MSDRDPRTRYGTLPSTQGINGVDGPRRRAQTTHDDSIVSRHSRMARSRAGSFTMGAGSLDANKEFEHMEDTKADMWTRLKSAMSKIVPPHRVWFEKQRGYEGLDYEETESEIEMEERRNQSQEPAWMTVVMRWLILFVVGIITAAIACSIDVAIENMAKFKFSTLADSINDCIANDCLFQSFLLWLGFDVLLVAIAATLVCYGEPIAAGSGIPEVKCYLNGIKMPHVVRLKTLVVKAIGVTCAVAGGMAIGKEGPMIHSGAVVAAGISQGKSTSLGWLRTNLFRRFRTDVEKRDFVSGGAAAGVSAAFGAPVGGVLFSLEEGASFWNQFLTWRIFFCSMTATFTLNILLSGIKEHVWGALSNPGLLNFGKFEDTPYTVEELPIFSLLGVCGGLLGALFNHLNLKLTKFRMKYIQSRPLKLLEAVCLAIFSVTVPWILMFFVPDCLPLGDQPESNPLQLFCPEQQYSATASLFFNTPETSIKTLFHAPPDDFQWYTLALFFCVYFMLACITYGLSIPSGLFVPCILTGAAFGRLIGTILALIFPSPLWFDPGKYALIGAAAMLGGVVRMTISLTVIIIEATGNVTYGLPIMLAVIFAKWTGDLFNEGLYDIHIELKHIPLLPWEPPHKTKWTLRATDIMNREVQVVRPVEKVGNLFNMLKSSQHNAFPVVAWESGAPASSDSPANLHGTILRSQLIVILLNRAFGPLSNDNVICDRLVPEDFRNEYPRWPKIDQVCISGDDREQWVDLRPYMNSCPFVVYETSSLMKLFRLFRTMGLRHLVVVNTQNQVVGLVTRKDLANISGDMKKADFFPSMVAHDRIRYILPDSYPYHSS